MTIKNVVVAGGGVLGSQIAYQAAYKGFAVTVWLRSEGSVERAKPKFEQLRQTYLATLEAMKSDPAAYCRGLADTPELSVDEIEQLKQRAQQAFESIVFTTSYEAAAKDADLVIEAIAEDPKQKDAFYAELAKYLPESTILVTNSSTLLPSQIAASTGRPEKFLALHFANRIWRNNTAEVMGHPGTDQAAYDEVVRFAADLGMVPLQLHKEQPGYILNSMLVPFLNAAEALYATGVADPETIDKTWMLGTGAWARSVSWISWVLPRRTTSWCSTRARKTPIPFPRRSQRRLRSASMQAKRALTRAKGSIATTRLMRLASVRGRLRQQLSL